MALAGKKIHFIGIGGAGMAPLAGIMLERGCAVSGSDSEPNRRCEELRSRGAVIYDGHDARRVPDGAAVVYSSAISRDNPELGRAEELGLEIFRRGEFLAKVADGCRRCVAVSGSHGKTSVTGMLAWCLARHFPGAGWLVGGDIPGFPRSRSGDGDIFVTEVDESDGTHTLVHPFIGLVPNVDDDHDWSVGGAARLEANFRLFGANSSRIIALKHPDIGKYFGSGAAIVDPEAPEFAELPGNLRGFQRLNGALAAACAGEFGISREEVFGDLAEFPGVERRLTPRGLIGSTRVIEDYAHHPAELAASMTALRELAGGEPLTVVFQPHRYARLEKYFDRLAAELRRADRVILVPVFAAWCESGKVGSAELAGAVGNHAEYFDSEDWGLLARRLADGPAASGGILAVIGAGSVGGLIRELQRLGCGRL